MKRLSLVFCTLVSLTLSAQESAPQAATMEEQFAEATAQYRQGKYSESAKLFAILSGRSHENASALTNWGLSAYQEGKKGLAVGLWRRALNVDPTARTARAALAFASKAMQLQEAEDRFWLDRLENRILGQVRLDQMLGASLLFLVLGGWPMVTYIGRRRRALRDEQPTPAFSYVGLIMAALFLATVTLTGLKAMAWTTPRATAVTAVSVRTGPDTQSSSLFDLTEGADVVVRQAKKGWTQIRHPGGMSGWVPQDTLFQTSGLPLW